MSIKIESEASCRKAYLNYHCYGNTMGITAKEMGEITTAWKNKLSSWQNSVSNDQNQYEFDDSDFETSKTKGKETAKDATGYDGNQAGQISRTVGTNIASVGAAGLSIAQHGMKEAGKNIGNIAAKVTGKETAKTATKSASWSAYASAILAIATAAAYMIKKPNKTQKEACDEMQTQLQSAQCAAADAQDEMERMGEEIMALSDEANDTNDAANDDIMEQKTEYDMYTSSMAALKAKAESGEPLTQEEKDLYKELAKLAAESGKNIETTQDDASDSVKGIYDEMGEYQDGYDYASETIGEIEGMTDYAASFDKSTKAQCYTEAASQGINAVSAGIAGARLMAGGWWNWALGIASIAAGVTSGIATKEQFNWAGQVGNEISTRKDTQDLNSATNDMYDQEITNYDAWMGGVEDLELDIPTRIDPPKETSLTNNELSRTEEVKKAKKEEDK